MFDNFKNLIDITLDKRTAVFRFSLCFTELQPIRTIIDSKGIGYFENRVKDLLSEIIPRYREYGIVDSKIAEFLNLNKVKIINTITGYFKSLIDGKYKLILTIPDKYKAPSIEEPNSLVTVTVAIGATLNSIVDLSSMNEIQRRRMPVEEIHGFVLLTGHQSDNEYDDGRNFTIDKTVLDKV